MIGFFKRKPKKKPNCKKPRGAKLDLVANYVLMWATLILIMKISVDEYYR